MWATLASVAADAAGVAAGLTVLDEAQAVGGDGPDVRLARADLYARDPARLRPVDRIGDGIETWPDADQIRLLYGLAEVYDRVGDEPAVVRTYRRLAARRPADASIWEALAERAARAGNQAEFTAARTAVARLDPSGRSAALCDGWAAVAVGKPDPAAVANMEKAFGPAPERAEACVALGWLRARANDPGAAGVLFDRASRLDPTRFGPAEANFAYLGRLPGRLPVADRGGPARAGPAVGRRAVSPGRPVGRRETAG